MLDVIWKSLYSPKREAGKGNVYLPTGPIERATNTTQGHGGSARTWSGHREQEGGAALGQSLTEGSLGKVGKGRVDHLGLASWNNTHGLWAIAVISCSLVSGLE